MVHQGAENKIKGVAAWLWKPWGIQLWSTAHGFGLPISRSICNGVSEDTEEVCCELAAVLQGDTQKAEMFQSGSEKVHRGSDWLLN